MGVTFFNGGPAGPAGPPGPSGGGVTSQWANSNITLSQASFQVCYLGDYPVQSNITVTLPASPNVGDTVLFASAAFFNHSMVVAANSSQVINTINDATPHSQITLAQVQLVMFVCYLSSGGTTYWVHT